MIIIMIIIMIIGASGSLLFKRRFSNVIVLDGLRLPAEWAEKVKRAMDLMMMLGLSEDVDMIHYVKQCVFGMVMC